MIGGTLAELWRNMEPIDTMVQRYVQPMFSQLQLVLGIIRRGWERSVSELLSPRVPPVTSSLRGVKLADHLFALMLPEFAGFSVCMFRQSSWRNIFRLKTTTYWKCENIFRNDFSKMKNEKKIVSDSCFVNPRNHLGEFHV